MSGGRLPGLSYHSSQKVFLPYVSSLRVAIVLSVASSVAVFTIFLSPSSWGGEVQPGGVGGTVVLPGRVARGRRQLRGAAARVAGRILPFFLVMPFVFVFVFVFLFSSPSPISLLSAWGFPLTGVCRAGSGNTAVGGVISAACGSDSTAVGDLSVGGACVLAFHVV